MSAKIKNELNCWVSFVLYAVIGKMAEADDLLKRHKKEIHAQAKRQAKLQPIQKKTLYRGLLFNDGRPVNKLSFFTDEDLRTLDIEGYEPERRQQEEKGKLVVDAEGRIPHAIDTMEFVSHTEDLDCAKWFSSPDSIISGSVRQHHPHACGFIMEIDEPPSLVLWHHTWTSALTKEISIPLEQAALMHPELRDLADQFRWNLRTQREVIVAASDKRFTVYSMDETDVAYLDKRFCHPYFLAQQQGHLQT